VKAAKPILEYDGLYGQQKDWTGDMFIDLIYKELSAAKPAPPRPAATPRRR
jgi:hypothetical protein